MLLVYLPVHFTHLTFCQRDVATWSYKEVGPQRIILQPYQPYTILKGGARLWTKCLSNVTWQLIPIVLPWNHLCKVFPQATARVMSKGWEALALRGRCSHGATDSGKLLFSVPTHETRIPLKARVKRAKLILFSCFDGIYSLTRLLFKAIDCTMQIVGESLPSLQIHIKEMLWLHIQMYTVSLVYVCQWVCGEVVGHRHLVLHITILQVRDLRPSFMHELSSGSTKVDLLGGRAYLNIFCILLAHIYIYIHIIIIHIMIYTTGLSE